jgi:hypothetical protein
MFTRAFWKSTPGGAAVLTVLTALAVGNTDGPGLTENVKGGRE